ncbi:hypothetical protein SPLC1_S101130 [Arthrospira platensis C1]|nr:hypothetical protein SPLC1_S101130 [Arthrospira platensis C1]
MIKHIKNARMVIILYLAFAGNFSLDIIFTVKGLIEGQGD